MLGDSNRDDETTDEQTGDSANSAPEENTDATAQPTDSDDDAPPESEETALTETDDRPGGETGGSADADPAPPNQDSEDSGELLPVDRRTVLGGTGLALGSGLIGYLLGSGVQPPGPGSLLGGGDRDAHLPFDVWDELQGTLRTTSQHLPGRATQLTAQARLRDTLDSSPASSGNVTIRVADDNESATTVAGNNESATIAGGGDSPAAGTNVGTTENLYTAGVPQSLAAQANETESAGGSDTEIDAERALEQLHEFVRDEIQTVPTSDSDIDDVATMVRWGGRGALRCGMGTPRDKAEALAMLCRDADFTATVRVAEVDLEAVGLTAEDIENRWLQSTDRGTEPDISDEQLEEWADRLDGEVPSESNVDIIDESGEESVALADELRSVLPADAPADVGEFDWRWDGNGRAAPVVEVFDDDNNIYHALPFGDVPFDQTELTGPIRNAPDPERQSVSVTLSAVTPYRLDDPLELVSGEWDVPDLIGRQLLVRTSSLLDPLDFPTAGFSSMDMFIPSLALQDPHLTPAEQAQHTEFGDMVTLSGDQYSADFTIEGDDVVLEDETIRRNGEEFYNPEIAPDPTEVDSLDVSVNPTQYPRITLEATALDENGNHVSGLPGSVFAATDEGERVLPTLTGTEPDPEILFLVDTSSSVSRGVDADVYSFIEEVIQREASGAAFERRNVNSAMWTHLAQAIGNDPSLIIYAHDGEPDNDTDPENVRPVLRNAPPTVILSDTDDEAPVENEVVLEQAELTGGEVAPLGDRELVEETVANAVSALDAPTYRFEYEVPDSQQGTREVELLVGENPTESAHRQATATYEAEDNGAASPLVGLHLTIEHDGREVTRTLGGWDPQRDEQWDPYAEGPDEETGFRMPNQEEFALETKMAMLGGVDISFEGDGVPLPVALDDIAQARHSYSDLHAAVNEMGIDGESDLSDEQYKEIDDIWTEGTMGIQWDPTVVQAPLPTPVDEDGLTYFVTPRIVLSQTKPTLENGDLIQERSLDVLPTTRAATAASGADKRFYRTLEQTARISVLEDAQFEMATRSLLDGVELTELANISGDDRDPYVTLVEQAALTRRHYQLVPRDASERAMWNIDRDTGTVLGIMPDGTGGAWRRQTVASVASNHQVDLAMDIFLEALEQIDCCSVASGGAMGAVGSYFELLAILYARVTGIIGAISVGGGAPNPSVGGIAAGVAADVAESKVKDQVPGSNWVSKFWQMADAANL